MARPMGARDRQPRKKRVYGVWFEGRRTAIVRSADSRGQAINLARKAKRRGGDRVVSARPITGASLRAAEAGRWTRERARPGDDSALRGYGPKPKGFRAAPTLAEFRRGRGPDRRPRKRRGLGPGLAVAGLGTLALGGGGAAVATMPSLSERRVRGTVRTLTKPVSPSLRTDLDDKELAARRARRMENSIKKSAGGSPEAEKIYRDIMSSGKATPGQQKELQRLARKSGRRQFRATKRALVRRFTSRKALTAAAIGTGVAVGAGAIYGLSRRRDRRPTYDYY